MGEIEEDDPYAVSSESDNESLKGPPPMINIAERTGTDLTSLKAALKQQKETIKDENRLEELNQLKQTSEIAKIKQDFIEGKIKHESENEPKAVDEEFVQISQVTKEQYSKFKDKFEKLPELMEQGLEERLKTIEKELTGVGKKNLQNIRGAFENPHDSAEIERENIVIERSEADRKRILSTFSKPELTADEAPKECAVCSKIVYPVERIFANKRNYHMQCFRCFKCSKQLTATNYNMHEGNLLCKLHYLEIFHPEIAKTMDPAATEEDERVEREDEEEFAISSKPKQLGADVIRSGGKVDDLSTIGSLQARKGDWESSAKEAATASGDKKTIAENEIASGKVKSNLERFVMGASNVDESEEDEDEVDGRDPNIVRETKNRRKEELKFEQVGDLKNKWKSGNVQGAADLSEMSKEDLEELRKGPNLKERYKERTEPDATVVKQWDSSELEASSAADARRSFLEGSAFQSTPVEKTTDELSEMEFKKLQAFKERFEKGEGDFQVQKTAVDVHAEVGDIKSAFEAGEKLDMTPEDRAEFKKKKIEDEFLRYKLVRRAVAQRHAAEQAAGGENDRGIEATDDVELGSIKDRFETGKAFKSQLDDKQLDVEIKIAGKAREKFQQIDAEGAQGLAPNLQPKEKHASKWDKKDNAVPEPINRRVINDDDEEPENEDAYDVKNLMNKFKNIGNETSTVKHERPSDLDTIKVEARNLKEQFEKAVTEDEQDAAEEKRKQLEEEFERLRREREQAAAVRDESPENLQLPQKEEINIAADHASKMTAKWEKIQKKEAKKAEKNKMAPKNAAQTDA